MPIWLTIKSTFKEFYEYLFIFILINVIWFFLITPLIFIGYTGFYSGWVMPVIISIILLGPVILSGLHFSNRLVERKAKFREIFTGIKLYFKKGLLGFLYTFIIYSVLFLDLFYFFTRGTDSKFMLILAVVVLYFIIFFSMSQLYFWGLLVYKQQEKVTEILKRSFLLVLDNLLFSFFWLIVILLLSIILTITGVGLPVLFMGLVSLMVLNGTKYTLRKYENSESGRA